MPTVLRILIVGTPGAGTNAMLSRMRTRGYGSQTAESLREARLLLKTFRFDVVLAAEILADGPGYDLADAAARRGATLLVSVTLSESCLWLPVVERGDNVLGRRALNARALEIELDLILDMRVLSAPKLAIPSARLKESGDVTGRVSATRRKSGELTA